MGYRMTMEEWLAEGVKISRVGWFVSAAQALGVVIAVTHENVIAAAGMGLMLGLCLGTNTTMCIWRMKERQRLEAREATA